MADMTNEELDIYDPTAPRAICLAALQTVGETI